MTLFDTLATTDALAALFSDESLLRSMLDVEAAVARAEARTGVIPENAAAAITRAAAAEGYDAAMIARGARESGTVAVPLVAALTNRVRAADPEAAKYVHWGLTSQDVADTALVLVLAKAHATLLADQTRLEKSLRHRSDRHAQTIMLGRTLLQPAVPITFGLKAALWYASAHRSWRRLSGAFDEALVLQFGGAAGTLGALGDRALATASEVAAELRLPLPDAPWHSSRDRLASLVANCGIHVGVAGKMARDVSLLMQPEVGEAAEPGGTSSTMPQKRNPVGCAIVLAAATRAPGLVSSYLTGLVQEHERSAGCWQAESSTVAAIVQTTGAALAAIATVAEGLTIDSDRMRSNLAASMDAVIAERLMFLMAPVLGRDQAHRWLSESATESRRTGRPFLDVVKSREDLTSLLSPDQWQRVTKPEEYLGAAEEFRRRLLAST